jgi:hypothetical protein
VPESQAYCEMRKSYFRVLITGLYSAKICAGAESGWRLGRISRRDWTIHITTKFASRFYCLENSVWLAIVEQYKIRHHSFVSLLYSTTAPEENMFLKLARNTSGYLLHVIAILRARRCKRNTNTFGNYINWRLFVMGSANSVIAPPVKTACEH